MVTIIFRLSIFLIVATILLVIVTPVLTVNSLLYPIKIDSAYIGQQQLAYNKLLRKGVADSNAIFLYSPSQLNVHYIDIKFTLDDSTIINGWMAIDTLKKQAPLLLIIPDITEGAVNYLPAMKEFYDRGFHVCVMDMRGQGNSGGMHYDFGSQAANDVTRLITKLKEMPFINRVAIMGIRTGAAIAIKAVADSTTIADVLIIQNPPASMAQFFTEQVIKEWGTVILPLMPALRRSYEQETGISITDFSYKKMIRSLYVPQMMVTANFFTKKNISETVAVYNSSNYFRKRLLIDNDSYMKSPGFENSKKYYDKISAFINSSLPGVSKKNRFRKLAMN